MGITERLRLARLSLSAILVVRFGAADGAKKSACKFASWFREFRQNQSGSSCLSRSATQAAKQRLPAWIPKMDPKKLANSRGVGG
jgi:hypothetical protein